MPPTCLRVNSVSILFVPWAYLRQRPGIQLVPEAISIIMALVNSNAVGKAVKSAGVNTYRTVRGRCIMSQRIFQNKSNTPAQSIQRGGFGDVSSCVKTLASWINLSFSKTRYGSQRNNFMTTNKALIEAYKLLDKNKLKGKTNLELFSIFLQTAQNAGDTILAGSGSIAANWNGVVYTNANYINISASRKFMAGDIVHVLISSVIDMPESQGMKVDVVNLVSYTLSQTDVNGLDNPFTFRIDNTNVPGFGTKAELLPPNANVYSTVLSATIEGIDKALSNTYFTTDYEEIPNLPIQSMAESGETGKYDLIFEDSPEAQDLFRLKPVGATFEYKGVEMTLTAFTVETGNILKAVMTTEKVILGASLDMGKQTPVFFQDKTIFVMVNPPELIALD